MAESTRDLWVGTMHKCASVHYAMCEVIRQHATSEQHVWCGKSSQTRNTFDLHVVVAQVSQYNPVHCQDPRLWCIVTEVATADSDDINCDEAKNVGIEINKDIDKGLVSEVTVKRSKQVKHLTELCPVVKVNNQTIYINPTVLNKWQRLIVLIERLEDMTRYFEYELSAEPTFLFKDGFM